MFRSVDESPILNKMLQRTSNMMAKQRGLPVIFGIVLFVLGFLLQLVNMVVGAPALELIHVILQNVGILVALVGLLLAEPLGN